MTLAEIFSHCHHVIFAQDKVNSTGCSQTRSPADPRGPVTHKKWDVGGLFESDYVIFP